MRRTNLAVNSSKLSSWWGSCGSPSGMRRPAVRVEKEAATGLTWTILRPAVGRAAHSLGRTMRAKAKGDMAAVVVERRMDGME